MWHNFELFQIVLWIKPVLISQPWFSQPFNQGFPRVFPTKTHGFSMIPWLWAFPSSSQPSPTHPRPFGTNPQRWSGTRNAGVQRNLLYHTPGFFGLTFEHLGIPIE
jgi:hypothetical protein